ncbi:MAG: O-antigen ligase family protein [Akkermansiaceae bacterium]|nr:O-antigen ligase family protein [Akkermansiaceae bacterium]
MSRFFSLLAFGLALAACLVAGLWGFGTAMTFQWPALLLVGAAVVFAALGRFHPGSGRGEATWLPAAAVLLAAALAARAMMSPVAYLAREDLALLGLWFGVYGLTVTIVARSKRRFAIAAALMGLLFVNLALVCWQFGVDAGQWIVPGYERTYRDRVGGVFNNPNHLAAWLAATTPLFLSHAILGRMGAHRRLLTIFASVLALLALGLTKSRGGMLAAGAGLGTLCLIVAWMTRSIWKRHRGPALAAVGGVVCLFAVLTAVNFDVLRERFGSRAYSAESESNRPLIWQSAWRQHLEAPAFGTGSRTFYHYGRRFRPPEMHVAMVEAEFVHNDYLQLLAEYGWTGFLAIGLFGAAHFWAGIRSVRHAAPPAKNGLLTQGRHLAFVAGALAGLVALAVHALVDFPLHIPALAFLSAFYLGILARPGESPHAAEKSVPRGARRASASSPWSAGLPLRVALGGTGCALLFFGLPYSRSEWQLARAVRIFEKDPADLRLLPLLKRARELDPANPFAHSLGGHAHLSALDHEMPPAAAAAFLKTALNQFEAASALYPQDVFAALGHASCLDALDRHEEAWHVLERARLWAPLYGNVMQAQGEHWLRLGDLAQAERYFEEARDAPAFRDWRTAYRSLEAVVAARKRLLPPSAEAVAGEPAVPGAAASTP